MKRKSFEPVMVVLPRRDKAGCIIGGIPMSGRLTRRAEADGTLSTVKENYPAARLEPYDEKWYEPA